MTVRCAIYYTGALKILQSPSLSPCQSLSTPMATFREIFNGLLFRSVLWMRVQNLKFVALPVAEIIGSTQKIWALPGYAQAAPKFMMGFCSDGPSECTGQIYILKSVALPVPEIIGVPKKIGQSIDIPTLLFSKILWAFVRMDSVKSSQVK